MTNYDSVSSCAWVQISVYSCLVQSRSLGRAANKADQRVSELQVLIEELQWDMEKIRRRENRLNAHLIEILERVRMCSLSCACVCVCVSLLPTQLVCDLI